MKKCKSCGGEVSRIGNYYVCEFCGNKWEIDSADDVHAVDRANAWSALRDGDFEKAQANFESILGKENQNHEAWWGKALAEAHITYVTDLNENKKVPTCNNITEDSFSESNSVRKAVQLAPDEIAASYKSMADQIDRIRREWLDKARKEPAYDVFLSYKDSDRENGIIRTQDSIDAQDLFNALTAEGYKVFFSRISLRDKISEQFEPYIYNAIKTAKVMIVFGEKVEYFNSTWIKNEWTRFRTRIEKNEKHKNSLVVVYKNIDPGELPASLRSRQCLNMTDMTFLSDLTRHIARVIEAAKQNAGLERISIEHTEMAKKADKLVLNTISTHNIGANTVETNLSTLERLDLVDVFLSAEDWESAESELEEILLDDPNSSEAKWKLLLVEQKCPSYRDPSFEDADDSLLSTIQVILDNASADFGKEILTTFYENVTTCEDDKDCYRLFERIISYDFMGRQRKLESAIYNCIIGGRYQTFCFLLNALPSDNVDFYIEVNLQYANICAIPQQKAECAERVISVDNSNLAALRYKVYADAELDQNKAIEDFENLLRYTDDQNGEVVSWLRNATDKMDYLTLVPMIIRYYNGSLSDCADMLHVAAFDMYKRGMYADAEMIYRVLVSENKDDADAYIGICESVIKQNDVTYYDVPEFSRFLLLADRKKQKKYIGTAKYHKLEMEYRQINEKLQTVNDHDLLSDSEKAQYEQMFSEVKEKENRFEELEKQSLDFDIPEISQKKDREKELQEKEDYLASLGMFKFQEKRKTQDRIASLRKEIAQYGTVIENTQREKKAELDAAKRDFTSNRIKAESYLSGVLFDARNRLEKRTEEIRNEFEQINPFLGHNEGDSISFGRYWFEADESVDKQPTHPISWTVQAVEQNRMLLLADHVIDIRRFHSKDHNISGGITWKESDIRNWLNDFFLKTAFGTDEQWLIQNSTITTRSYPDYREAVQEYQDTIDKVFLLSAKEMERVFERDKKTMCIQTPYAQKKYTGEKENVNWWLRDTVHDYVKYAYSRDTIYKNPALSDSRITYNAILDSGVMPTSEGKYGIRPAIFVDTSIRALSPYIDDCSDAFDQFRLEQNEIRKRNHARSKEMKESKYDDVTRELFAKFDSVNTDFIRRFLKKDTSCFNFDYVSALRQDYARCPYDRSMARDSDAIYNIYCDMKKEKITWDQAAVIFNAILDGSFLPTCPSIFKSFKEQETGHSLFDIQLTEVSPNLDNSFKFFVGTVLKGLSYDELDLFSDNTETVTITPGIIKKAVSKAEAEEIKEWLERFGASVTIIPSLRS